jgi:hypothetical protein
MTIRQAATMLALLPPGSAPLYAQSSVACRNARSIPSRHKS